jgi:hypothetical protein
MVQRGSILDTLDLLFAKQTKGSHMDAVCRSRNHNRAAFTSQFTLPYASANLAANVARSLSRPNNETASELLVHQFVLGWAATYPRKTKLSKGTGRGRFRMAILRQGVAVWNAWREANSAIQPDLYEADLGGANLAGINLRGAYINEVFLGGADLYGAQLSGAHL